MIERAAELVTIEVQSKEYGIYVTSDDVPGLYLWGHDPEVVFADVAPTIQSLYLHNQRRHVSVRAVEPGVSDTEPRQFQVYDEESQAGTA